MTRHRIAQIGENRNPKSPENRPQTRRFLQIRLLQLRRSATPFNGLAVLHGRLLSGIAEPARSHIADTFRQTMGSMDERFVQSTRAVEQREFPRLWLTDAAVLTELANSHVLLTADLDLYLAASQRGHAAINFNHLRQL